MSKQQLEAKEPETSKVTMPYIDEEKYMNILLLGESGTGKSTFINAFANYLQHASLEEAEEEGTKLCCLIPAKFSVTTEDGDLEVVTFKNDNNEDDVLGNSSTQATKAYIFPFEKKMIRLIDTPGINDSRGAVTKDRENFEDILDYIGHFKYLHAICFLLKPDQTVLTAAFKYCLVELLSRLDRSAAGNIMFLFTRTRSTGYGAPETLNCVRRILNEIEKSENVTIPLYMKHNERKNCFFFDNEGFTYLVARHQGKHMGNEERFQESWNVSYNASWDLIHHILGDDENPPLPPHNVQDTVSVNKARLLIFDLAKPLADITELVQDNVDALKQHKDLLAKENLSATELKAMLYVPIIDINEKELAQPVTVCAASKCRESHIVAGITKYHYRQRCHNPCYLSGVSKEIMGDLRLVQCAAMSGSNCKRCGCRFTTHMHIYYETCTMESRTTDLTVEAQLASNQDLQKHQRDIILEMEKLVDEYLNEHKQISTALATFAYFLRRNSICPINDAYEAYLDCLISNENVAHSSNDQLLKRYQSLKKEHIEQKQLLENAGKQAEFLEIKHVTSDTILKLWEGLKKLPHTGNKVSSLHHILVSRKRKEMLREMEYVHSRQTQPRQKKLSVKDGLDDLRNVISKYIKDGQLASALRSIWEYIANVERNQSRVTKSFYYIKHSLPFKGDKEKIYWDMTLSIEMNHMAVAVSKLWACIRATNNTTLMTELYSWFTHKIHLYSLGGTMQPSAPSYNGQFSTNSHGSQSGYSSNQYGNSSKNTPGSSFADTAREMSSDASGYGNMVEILAKGLGNLHTTNHQPSQTSEASMPPNVGSLSTNLADLPMFYAFTQFWNQQKLQQQKVGAAHANGFYFGNAQQNVQQTQQQPGLDVNTMNSLMLFIQSMQGTMQQVPPVQTQQFEKPELNQVNSNSVEKGNGKNISKKQKKKLNKAKRREKKED